MKLNIIVLYSLNYTCSTHSSLEFILYTIYYRHKTHEVKVVTRHTGTHKYLMEVRYLHKIGISRGREKQNIFINDIAELHFITEHSSSVLCLLHNTEYNMFFISVENLIIPKNTKL